jgi:hypothetical protein
MKTPSWNEWYCKKVGNLSEEEKLVELRKSIGIGMSHPDNCICHNCAITWGTMRHVLGGKQACSPFSENQLVKFTALLNIGDLLKNLPDWL